MTFILFEKGSAKWIELIPGNARFHSSKENATKIDLPIDSDAISELLDKHNIDWYRKTIEIQVV